MWICSRMGKKVIIGYVIYGLAIYAYLFWWAPAGIPQEYAGTVAYPATFMTAEQLAMSVRFARIRHLLFFLPTPFEWLAIFFFIFGGMSAQIEADPCGNCDCVYLVVCDKSYNQWDF